ncbi:hypothetical protein EK904_008593 [Melospiza melodia maxima]|nr:hypothetical protein EK904_008593 [Melospiza melodia maxima]
MFGSKKARAASCIPDYGTVADSADLQSKDGQPAQPSLKPVKSVSHGKHLSAYLGKMHTGCIVYLAGMKLVSLKEKDSASPSLIQCIPLFGVPPRTAPAQAVPGLLRHEQMALWTSEPLPWQTWDGSNEKPALTLGWDVWKPLGSLLTPLWRGIGLRCGSLRCWECDVYMCESYMFFVMIDEVLVKKWFLALRSENPQISSATVLVVAMHVSLMRRPFEQWYPTLPDLQSYYYKLGINFNATPLEFLKLMKKSILPVLKNHDFLMWMDYYKSSLNPSEAEEEHGLQGLVFIQNKIDEHALSHCILIYRYKSMMYMIRRKEQRDQIDLYNPPAFPLLMNRRRSFSFIYSDFIEKLHSYIKTFQTAWLIGQDLSKCNVAITEVSSSSGNTGELIKCTVRCCQPQMSANWIISQGRYSKVPKTSKGTLLFWDQQLDFVRGFPSLTGLKWLEQAGGRLPMDPTAWILQEPARPRGWDLDQGLPVQQAGSWEIREGEKHGVIHLSAQSGNDCKNAKNPEMKRVKLLSSKEAEWYYWIRGGTLNLLEECYQCLTPSSLVLSQTLTKSHSQPACQEHSDKASKYFLLQNPLGGVPWLPAGSEAPVVRAQGIAQHSPREHTASCSVLLPAHGLELLALLSAWHPGTSCQRLGCATECMQGRHDHHSLVLTSKRGKASEGFHLSRAKGREIKQIKQVWGIKGQLETLEQMQGRGAEGEQQVLIRADGAHLGGAAPSSAQEGPEGSRALLGFALLAGGARGNNFKLQLHAFTENIDSTARKYKDNALELNLVSDGGCVGCN